MDLGADDYLTKPVANADLIRAIETRLRRSQQQAAREFKPDFSSAEPLQRLPDGGGPGSDQDLRAARRGECAGHVNAVGMIA